MANNSYNRNKYNNLRDKINNKAPIKKKVKQEKNDEETSLLSEIFPVIIVLFILVGIGVFYLLFNTYKEVLIVDSDGYFLDTSTLILGNKKTEVDSDSLEFVSVKEKDIIYKNALNHYVDNDKDQRVNIQYPLFLKDGLSFINYNENINLINNEFERSTGYSGLVISYGRVFDIVDYTQIDQEKYLLLSYDDDVMINLYDLKIKTFVNEYYIPVNSFVFFEEDSISYYERTASGFKYNMIKDVDFTSTIKFYYDSAKETFEYTYEEFLKGIDTIYIKDFVIEEPVTPDKPIEEVIPPSKDEDKNENVENEFVWEKPSVIVGDLKTSVYSMTGKLQIKDPAHVIVKEPTFTFYRNNKTFLRRTYYTSGDMKITGLIPSTTFTMVGTYTYLANDMKTRIVVTFYSNQITTKSLDDLPAISLSFINGRIFPKKVEVNNLKVTSDLENEAISGVNKISLNIDDKVFYLSNNQVIDIINGRDTTIESPESLSSSSQIDYKFALLDREGNELKTTNSAGTTRTSKRPPNVSLRLKSSEIDSVTLGVNVKNEDNIEFTNYIYVVTRSDGVIIKEDFVPNGDIILTDLDPDQLFNVSLYADYDIDDGNGVIKKSKLSSIDFTSKPITTLGYINMPMTILESTADSTTIQYNINSRRTNIILTRLLQKLKFDIYDETGEELIDSIVVDGEDIINLKDGLTNEITFDHLNSFTKYKLVVTTIIQQGSTIYELGTTQGLDDFMTRKLPAQVLISNPFTTETMIDFDISISDVDGSIDSEYVRLELRDKDQIIVDTKKIPINSDPERVTYNNLRTNEFYNIYVYADGYNETHLSSNYEAKHLLAQKSIYTESGISGKIELVSSLRVAKGRNIADVKSEVKWLQMNQTYNIPKTIDEDGNMHIYSKTGASAYTYDLSDYHGEIVTVSFKVKTVTPVHSNYNLYFTQHYSGTTSTNYSKVLSGLSDKDFKEFSYTFKVGSYYGLADPSKIDQAGALFTPVYSVSHGQNYADAAGFYINGGTGEMAEYIIKDFEIHVQYDKVEYKSDIELEPGNWSNKKLESDAKVASDYHIRSTKGILLEGNKRYSFEYDNTTDYDIYFYLFKADGTYEKAYGYVNSEYSFFIPEDRYVRLVFRYHDGVGIINPEDINNLKIYQYSKNDVTSDAEYDYELVTKAKVSISDKLDQIATNDYYIKIYENNVEVKSYNYVELKDDVLSISDVIKEIDLQENKNYVVELGILHKDRYYALSNFEISTEDEVLGISTTNDWVRIQPYGNYILLNDLDFQNFTDRRIGNGYRYFHGVIDFQGYTVKQATAKTDGTSNTYYYRIQRIENDAVLKNLVLDVQLNNQNLNSSVYGFVQYNYGTIENVIVNITDTKESQMPQELYGLLTYYNGLKGKINNFVVKLNGDVHYYANSSLFARENYGSISNGYMYGGDVVVDFNLVSGTARNLGLLTRYSGPKATIQNVFTTVSYSFPNNSDYDYGGILAYQNAGTIKNAYVYGEANPYKPSYGPVIQSAASTSKLDNVFYLSDNIYTSTYQSKASLASLHDASFQHSILGDAFNIEEMLSLGYYPQVIFTSNKMPKQDFIELPPINESTYADIIFMEVMQNSIDKAKIKVTVDNPLGEEITDISIANLTTTILEQSFNDGRSEVIIQVSNPAVYTSKYAVDSITSISPNGYKSTRKYQPNELFLKVDLFRKIYTVDDFIKIKNYNSQNYKLMNDLDFYGYSNYYISTFSGVFDGSGHKMSNINITSSSMDGLFGQMNGTLKNVTFENVYKHSKTTYQGVVGRSNANGKFDNVHVNNFTLEIDETMTTDTMRIGALVGQASQSSISFSSATDVTITSVSEAPNLNIGGLVGRGSGLFVNNSFVQNVNITVENAISSQGIGGLLGYETSANGGSIDNCYSTGSITTNTANIGGIAGNGLGYVTNSYSTVDLVSDMSHIGGISGNSYATAGISNSLYLGNLYSASEDEYFHRISGNYQSEDTNYAMDTNLINGKISDERFGENLRTYDDYKKEETYQEIFISDAYDYSKVSEGILPKLYKQDGKTLIPNQRDNYLYKNLFNIKEFASETFASYASVVLTLENPDNYQISDIKIEDAFVNIKKNVTENNYTQIEFELRPDKYFDSYRISEFTYVDENGEEQKINRNIKIDAVFYKELNDVDDWNNISTSVAENYSLTADIDFSKETDIKTNVMFNRLEATGEDANKNPISYTIKGIKLNYTKNANYHVLIQKVVTSLKNVNFEGITITDKTSSSNNYVGIMMYNYGDIQNVSFKDILIDAPKEHYVAPIAVNYGSLIKDINITNVDVNGKRYVGGLVAYVSNTVNDDFDNINAIEVDVNGTDYCVGGIFGEFASAISYQDKPKYKNINITSSRVLGTAYHVGGVAGRGDCNYCTVDDVEVSGKYYVGGVVGYQRGAYQYGNLVKGSHISGTSYYIGGVYGHSYYAYDMHLMNSTVEGLTADTHSVGGITGYRSGYSLIYRAGVLDSTIKTPGENAGGIIGRTVNDNYVYFSYVDNSNIIAYNKAGGISGEMNGVGYIRYSKVSNTNVVANNNYAGGAIGYYYNDNAYGSYKDGFVQEVSLENVNVKSNYYAGGIFGALNGDIYYAERLRKIYYSGTVKTDSNTTVGVASGDHRNISLLRQPRIYIYDKSLVNGTEVKNNVGISIKNEENLLENIQYSNGYINSSGVPTYNENDINALYTDFIPIKAGKTYYLNIDYVTSSSGFNIYLYNSEYVYKSLLSSSTVDSYIDSYRNYSNYNDFLFTAYKDCYLRINITNKKNINNITLHEVSRPNAVDKSQLLNASQLRDKLTWVSNISTTTNANATRLLFTSNYWDYSNLEENAPTISVTDKSTNKYVASGKVASISTNGVLFDSKANNEQALKVNNYVLPSNKEFTLNTKFSVFSSRAYAPIFTVMKPGSANGFGLFVHSLQLYVLINGSYYATGYYVPYVREVDVTVTYANKVFNVYIEDNEDPVFTKTDCATLPTTNTTDFETYIGYSKYYNGRSNSYNFVGRIQNVKIFNKVLSYQERLDNYNASGVSDTSSLDLYFDFTSTGIEYDAYYPLLKSNSSLYDILYQRNIPMPKSNENFTGVPVISTYSLSSPLLSEYVDVYSSGIDTINVEFKEISNDMSLKYRIGDNEYQTKVNKRVYTLHYDYVSDIEIELSNSHGSRILKYSKDDLAKKISFINNNYYYVDKDYNLYMNEGQLINDIVHLYGNLALLSNGKVYNLSTGKIQNMLSSKGILANSKPLKTSVLNDRSIKTYYNYSLIDNEEFEGQLFIKDNHAYVFNSSDTLNNNLVYNLYNTEEYQIALNKKGYISSYKAGIIYPNSFVNDNIAEITFDENGDEPIIMIRYDSSNILAFNYITGEELFNVNNSSPATLFEYLSSSLSMNTYSLSSSSEEYIESKNFMSSLDKATDNNVNDVLDLFVTSDNSTSNILDSEYISVYNSSSKKFDVYNVNEIITVNKDIIDNETSKEDAENNSEELLDNNKVINYEDKVVKLETKPVNSKVKSNFVLYKYFYHNKRNSTVEDNRTIIYIVIIGIVIINLFVLSYIYSKKEVTNE